MAEAIKAIFEARETISEALGKAKQATSSLGRDINELQQDLLEAGMASSGFEEELEGFIKSAQQADVHTNDLQRSLNAADRAFLQLAGGTEVTDQQIENFTKSVAAANQSAMMAKSGINGMKRSILELGVNTSASSSSLNQFERVVDQVRNSTVVADSVLSSMNRTMFATMGAAMSARRSMDTFSDEIRETAIASSNASAQLGILASIAEASSFSFSSLSVNIGPFNLALKNILVQLPAILTGMGAMLALVTSLATAFLLLGGALGAFVGAGAIAFFEDFSKEFEDTTEAVEALMGALKDLFKAAIEPLMTEANVDLFKEAINDLAIAVNIAAQFLHQMRDAVFELTSGIEGDLEKSLEALHDSFVMVTPVVQGLINWFLNGFPKALMAFTEFTTSVSDELGMLVSSFSKLFFQLLSVADLLINAVGPIFASFITVLADFFVVLNSINKGVTSTILKFIALSAIWVKAMSVAMTLKGAMLTLNSVMLSQAAVGSFLGNVYFALNQAVRSLLFTDRSLSKVLKTLRKQMLLNLGVTKASTTSTWSFVKAKVASAASALGLSSALSVATLAAKAFWGAITGGILPAIVTLISVISVVMAAFMNWGGIVNFVKGLFGGFLSFLKSYVQYIATVLIPIINFLLVPFQFWWQVVGAITDAIGSLIGRLSEMIPFGDSLNSVGSAFEMILKAIDKANIAAEKFIELLNKIPGIDIEGPAVNPEDVRSQIEGEGKDVTDTDDIQTEPNVDLSFEDSLEQNMEVNADPEEKEQMKRVVKDALNEANATARRQEGMGR